MPRQLKHFDVRTEVNLSNDLVHQRTVVEIITLDRPGLVRQLGSGTSFASAALLDLDGEVV